MFRAAIGRRRGADGTGASNSSDMDTQAAPVLDSEEGRQLLLFIQLP
jgi:hypothetical protein